MRNKIWEAPNGWIVKRSFLSKDAVEIADQIMRCKNITWSDLWFLMEGIISADGTKPRPC